MRNDGNQALFLSLEVPDGHFTCIITQDGKQAFLKFTKMYGSTIEIKDSEGKHDIVNSFDKIKTLFQPVHGNSYLINYSKGGHAFVDYNDDMVVFVLPREQASVLASVVDFSSAYQDAVEELEAIKTLGSSTEARHQFGKLLHFALRK